MSLLRCLWKVRIPHIRIVVGVSHHGKREPATKAEMVAVMAKENSTTTKASGESISIRMK